jgi:hypothetical protein
MLPKLNTENIGVCMLDPGVTTISTLMANKETRAPGSKPMTNTDYAPSKTMCVVFVARAIRHDTTLARDLIRFEGFSLYTGNGLVVGVSLYLGALCALIDTSLYRFMAVPCVP